jgi:hypothetical protein
MPTPVSLDPFSWESLNQCADEQAMDRLLLAQLRALAAQNPGVAQTFFRAVGKSLNSVLRIGSYGKFVKCPWNELVELYSEQVIRSQRFDASPESGKSSDVIPFSGKAFTTVIRKHSQQPCTTVTVRRRVEVVRGLCALDEPILVLGDDDFLSLALAEAGYKDVTTLDIDASLIQKLNDEAKRRGVVIKARTQDLLAPLPSDLVRPYRVAVFDPMCTVEGVRFFTEAAIRLSGGNQETVFFLNTHLMSLLRPGLSELKEFMSSQGFEVDAFYPAFNVYPVSSGAQRLLRALLSILNGLFFRNPALRSKAAVVKWFVSDAMLLRHKKRVASSNSPETVAP